MISPLTLNRWLFHLLFLALVAVIVFIQMLPLPIRFAAIPGPDLILALVFAWFFRRPEYVPVLLVALVFLLTGILFQAPPGLHAALVVIGLEFLRSRSSMWRDLPFLTEWALVMLVMALIFLAERLVLGLFIVEQASFGSSVLRFIITSAFYPLVVAFSVYALRVRRLLPGDSDALRLGL